MPNDRQSVFTPLTPDQLEGPFQGFLRPPEPQETAAQLPPWKMSTAGGVAMVASKFLESASKAKIKAFEERENEKIQKLNQLDRYRNAHMGELTPAGQTKL